MKTKIIAGSLLAVSLFMTSCKKELQPQESAEPTEAVAADGAATPAEGQPVSVQPQQMQAQPQVQPQVQPQPVATAPGMNPPHGQPGHRCDIQVGAPLNSPPGQKPAPTAVAQPQPVAQPTVTPNKITPVNNADVVTAPGMNPPHGQPGHRCDIAVGQPLPKA
ncbi:hypothetical protein [Flavobacterium lindanitolerans]|uniref:hypothetical protein n=1 Tax=Flavobacterium lindanitolerans TaxID=428988 RepID=UPI00280A3F8A|nr:hypothetical protein [Flavobacterium lindanitolerans]MDQ7959622.1 hypothetical protein [Flavobacterium lindanitolerans]